MLPILLHEVEQGLSSSLQFDASEISLPGFGQDEVSNTASFLR
jgi:hypothetical protein